MALTKSQMLPLGTQAPDFNLPDFTGKRVSLADFQDAPALLVMFICNHCPHVPHVRPTIARLTSDYAKKGVASVGINSNDAQKYPADSPAMMEQDAQAAGYTFPYLVDESQSVAKAYRAACTPEFYLFDKNHKLYYRGRLDGSTPSSNVPTTGEDLRRALDSLLVGKPAPREQHASMGCNIKWKPGNEPDYFG